jgi:hypothetical protein
MADTAALLVPLTFALGLWVGARLERLRWQRAARGWPRWLWCGERLFWVTEHNNSERGNTLW